MHHLTKIAILVSLLGFWTWFAPYYYQQKNLYEKYSFVLEEECVDGKFHPMVQHNLMTYDGIPTNCSHARTSTSVPIVISTVMAMYTDSVFYTLINAVTWQLKVVYALVFMAVALALIFTRSRMHTVTQVMKSRQPPQQQRVIFPLKTDDAPSSDMHVLARKLVGNPLLHDD